MTPRAFPAGLQTAFVLFGLVAAACAPDTTVERVDLADWLAERRRSAGAADLFDDRLEGFGPAVRSVRHGTHRQARGPRSAFRVALGPPSGTTRVRVDVVATRDGKRRRMRLRVNDTWEGELRRLGRRGMAEWAVPAHALHEGENTLAIVVDDAQGATIAPDEETFRLYGLEVDGASFGDASRFRAGEVLRVPVVVEGPATVGVDAIGWDGLTAIALELHRDGPVPRADALVALGTWTPTDAAPRALPLGADDSGWLVLTGAGDPDTSARIEGLHLAQTLPRPPTPTPTPTPTGPPPDIVLWVADTVRADRVSALGYDVPTTPVAAALPGAQIWTADSNAPWTRPSVATILTGLDQRAHGVSAPTDTVPPDVPYLPQRLRDGGYATIGFAVNSQVQATTGFGRGFDTFWDVSSDAPWLAGGKPRAAAYLPAAVDAVAAVPADRPVFLFIHSLASHYPYDPPPDALAAVGAPDHWPTLAGEPLRDSHAQLTWIHAVNRGEVPLDRAELSAMSTLYDGDIHSEDAQVGALVDALRALGRWDRTLFVFTSDHGELFGEHGKVGHGQHGWRELLEVPLVIRWPAGWARPTVTRPALADLTPTLAAAAGLPPVTPMHGRDLRKGEPAPRHRYGHVKLTDVYAWWDDRFKLVLYPGEAPRLFDVAADPDEAADVAALYPARVAAMRHGLERRIAADEAIREGFANVPVTSERLDEQLEVLGYIE